jgi:hypothetical protein
VLLKKYQVSHNRSRDGVLDLLPTNQSLQDAHDTSDDEKQVIRRPSTISSAGRV